MRENIARLNESTLAAIGLDRATIAAFRHITKQVGMVLDATTLPEVAARSDEQESTITETQALAEARDNFSREFAELAELKVAFASMLSGQSQIAALFEQRPIEWPDKADLSRIFGRIAELEAQLADTRAPLAPSLPPVVAPTLQNSWVAYGAGVTDPGYYKDGGRVYLQGTVKSGVIGSLPIFTLPLGLRPAGWLNFANSSNSSVGQVSINAAGEVVPLAGSNLYFSLDGVSFRPV